MTMTKREKSVVRRAIEKLWGTKAAKTDRDVKSALRIMQREADEPEVEVDPDDGVGDIDLDAD